VEAPDQREQMLRLRREAPRGRGQLLRLRGVPLDHLVHLGHGALDLIDTGGLLLRGGGDLRNEVGDPRDRAHDLLERPARAVTSSEPAFTLAPESRMGEPADLGGHQGEAAALLAGAGGLDGGVEGEEIGLERDLVDGGDDVGDLLGRGVDAAHDGHGIRHDPPARAGGVARAIRQLRGLEVIAGSLGLVDRPGRDQVRPVEAPLRSGPPGRSPAG
jgi:hypothetical protein